MRLRFWCVCVCVWAKVIPPDQQSLMFAGNNDDSEEQASDEEEAQQSDGTTDFEASGSDELVLARLATTFIVFKNVWL